MNTQLPEIRVVGMEQAQTPGIEHVGWGNPLKSEPASPLAPAWLQKLHNRNPQKQYRKWLWQQLQAEDKPVMAEMERLKQKALQQWQLQLLSVTYPQPSHVEVVAKCLTYMLRQDPPAPKAKASSTKPVNNAQRINQDSGKVEYYTPQRIVDAARMVMGSIDLDPASSPQANATVRARRIYTLEDDGLSLLPWKGRIFMNHPFGRKNNPKWINRLVWEYYCGDVMEACCITYASTSERWFQPLFDFPQCYLSPRTNYLLPNGTVKKDVPKGSVVTYMGTNILEFLKQFKPLGRVMLPEWRIPSQQLVRLFGYDDSN